MSDVTVEAAQKPLTPEEIQAFAVDWYHKLDVHESPEELVAMVAADGMQYWADRGAGGPELVSAPPLEFVLPEGTATGVAGFCDWYKGVIRLFFDEVHAVCRADVSDVSHQGGQVHVKVVVNWQARRWDPSTPRSDWIGFDAYQDWVMVRSAETGQPVILRYVVNELRPMPGSTDL